MRSVLDERGWLVELDGLTFGKCLDGRLKTVTFTDPAAIRYKQQGDAEYEKSQLEIRFPWMKGRLVVNEHLWIAPGEAHNGLESERCSVDPKV